MPSVYHPSPLAVPSPNWMAISAFMTSEGLALKTPKVLDNFVFDVLPPNTPNTPKMREKSPEPPSANIYDRVAFERRAAEDRNRLDERRLEEQRRMDERRLEEQQRRLEERRLEERRLDEQRRLDDRRLHHHRGPSSDCVGVRTVTFANQVTTRSLSLTPPPPYPEDLSVRHHHNKATVDDDDEEDEEEEQQQQQQQQQHMVVPKREIMDDCVRLGFLITFFVPVLWVQIH